MTLHAVWMRTVVHVLVKQAYFETCVKMGECLLFSAVMWGSRVRGRRRQQNQQAHQEGWLSPGAGAWNSGGGVREENALQIEEHHEQLRHSSRLLRPRCPTDPLYSSGCQTLQTLLVHMVSCNLWHRTDNLYFLLISALKISHILCTETAAQQFPSW